MTFVVVRHRPGTAGLHRQTRLGSVKPWLWISAIVILLGTELDAEMEHQTARATTEGSPKPIGNLGARVADTIGQTRK